MCTGSPCAIDVLGDWGHRPSLHLSVDLIENGPPSLVPGDRSHYRLPPHWVIDVLRPGASGKSHSPPATVRFLIYVEEYWGN